MIVAAASTLCEMSVIAKHIYIPKMQPQTSVFSETLCVCVHIVHEKARLSF